MAAKARKESARWYWAELIVFISPISQKVPSRENRVGTVWKDLVILQAKSPGEAVDKANDYGVARNGDVFSQSGKACKSKFLGVGAIGLIHEGLRDGSEITFSEHRSTLRKAKVLVERNNWLKSALEKELEPSLYVEGMSNQDMKKAAKSVAASLKRVLNQS